MTSTLNETILSLVVGGGVVDAVDRCEFGLVAVGDDTLFDAVAVAAGAEFGLVAVGDDTLFDAVAVAAGAVRVPQVTSPTVSVRRGPAPR